MHCTSATRIASSHRRYPGQQRWEQNRPHRRARASSAVGCSARVVCSPLVYFVPTSAWAFAFSVQNSNVLQPTAPRRPLADISNAAPINFGSPIKRSRSEPVPGTCIPAAIALQSPLSPLGRAAIITLAVDQQPIPLIATKLSTSEKTIKKWTT